MLERPSPDPIEAGMDHPLLLYLQNPSICAAELDGEICLFNPSTATYLNLNGPASAIWNLIASKVSEETIISVLLDTYEVDEALCMAETREFLSQAVEQGMVEVHPL
jgi:hypothetical protein